MRNLVGTAIGAAIDRRDGDSGVKGAALGYATSGLLKFTVKIAAVAAVGLGALAVVRNRRTQGA